MTGNIHLWGHDLQSVMRPEVANHSITLSREDEDNPPKVTIGPFSASSGPIQNEMLTGDGVAIPIKNRIFNFDANLTGVLGEPQVGDEIVDTSDNTTWRILPQGDNYAWRWHGQHKQAYSVITEQDS